MTVRYISLITLPSPAEATEKLVVSGAIITLVGFAIMIVGIVPLFLRRAPAEIVPMLSVGSSVTILGIATIIRAMGHGNERVLFVSAWSVAGGGTALIFAYCTWYIIARRRVRVTKK
jgi:hypothetical protein